MAVAERQRRGRIYKLASGKYRVRYYVDGVRKSKTFTLKRDAEAFDREVHRAIERGELDRADSDLQTLAELAAEHMAAERDALATRTLATYRSLWSAHVDARILGRDDRQWHHAIAETPLRLLKPKVIEQWRDERIKAGAGETAIRKVMALMKTMLSRAVRDETITANPADHVRKPSGKRRRSIVIASPEQVEQIRARLDDEGKALVSVLAYSGMRPGEALALRWADVGERTLRIEGGTDPDGKAKETKTGPPRNVVLMKPLATDLKAWRKQANGSPLVFPRGERSWSENDWRNWRRRKFAPAAEAAGLDMTRAYDLRHSIASLWIHEGIDVAQVAAWLGHRPSETWDTYTHVVRERNGKSAEQRINAARRKRRARQPA